MFPGKRFKTTCGSLHANNVTYLSHNIVAGRISYNRISRSLLLFNLRLSHAGARSLRPNPIYRAHRSSPTRLPPHHAATSLFKPNSSANSVAREQFRLLNCITVIIKPQKIKVSCMYACTRIYICMCECVRACVRIYYIYCNLTIG